MPDDTERMASMRCDRAASNLHVKPIDLLRAAAHDVETGLVKCDGVLILFAYRPEDGDWQYDNYRAGLTRDQEIVTLSLAQERVIRQWRTE